MRPSASRKGSLLVETQVSGRSGQVSTSSMSTSGSPVAMMRCSSSYAVRACSSLKNSKSVRPSMSAALSTSNSLTMPWLTRRNRLCRSLK